MKDLLDVSSGDAARPLALSFEDEPTPARHRPPSRPQASPRASPAGRLASFAVDGVALSAAFCAVAGVGLIHEPYRFDALVREAPLWSSLAALLGVAYSFLFVGLAGRTPGMALAGRRVTTVRGDPLTPGEALLRALVALASVPALFGFALSLFDRRGQTLHDKLCGCVVAAVD